MFSRLDVEGLKNLHALTGVDVATMTDDNTDIRWVSQKIRTNFAQMQAAEGDRWRDLGWWLVIPLTILFAFSFRKGWVVRVGTTLLAARLLMPVEVEAADLTGMWLTPDQKGRIAYDKGDFEAASSTFCRSDVEGYGTLPGRQVCRSARFPSPPSIAQTAGTIRETRCSTSASLTRRPPVIKRRSRNAGIGRTLPSISLSRKKLIQQKKDDEEEQQDKPNLPPDSVQFDDKGKQGKAGKMNIAEQTSELWMKNIIVSPADLMARKFAIEAQQVKP